MSEKCKIWSHRTVLVIKWTVASKKRAKGSEGRKSPMLRSRRGKVGPETSAADERNAKPVALITK